MKYFNIITVLLLFACLTGKAQQNKFYYENAVYRENIKTVQMYRAGFEL